VAHHPSGERKSRVSAKRPPPAICDALAILARLEHYTLAVDPTCRLCFAQRTVAPFEQASQIEACFATIELLLAEVPRGRYALLVDARSGPGRNDPAFEAGVAQHRGRLLLGFAKNAALATTAAGRLQIQRYAKVDGRLVFATDSLEAALRYLGLPLHSV
jgi:hypothetical protein